MRGVCENVFEAGAMEWVPLESSVLASAAYLRGKHVLCLKFHSGEIYCYLDYPPEQYEEFLRADSKGGYFAQNIRDRFRFWRLHRRKGSHDA
jgi:hypothetical protein